MDARIAPYRDRETRLGPLNRQHNMSYLGFNDKSWPLPEWIAAIAAP